MARVKAPLKPRVKASLKPWVKAPLLSAAGKKKRERWPFRATVVSSLDYIVFMHQYRNFRTLQSPMVAAWENHKN
jgi:hypothetical protein